MFSGSGSAATAGQSSWNRQLGWLSLFLLSTGSLVAAETENKIEREENWQVVYMSGQRVGYSHTLIEPFEKGNQTLVRCSSVTNLTIKRFGQSLVMKQTLTTEETTDGSMLRFSYESANPPASSTLTVGTVDGDQLTLKSTVNGKSKTSTQAWRKDVKSPAFQDRALRNSPLKPGETRSFEAFMPEFNKVTNITLNATDFEETQMLDGKSQRLLKVNVSQSLVPVIIAGFVDNKGVTLKTSTSLLKMATYQVDKSEALKIISGEEIDLAVSFLIKVKRIPDAHTAKSIRYRVTAKAQNPADVLPSCESQTVKKTSDDSAEVTIFALPIPDTAKVVPGKTEFLESSQYIQADDERVQEHANKAAGDEKDPAKLARRMERYVFEKLAKKNFSTAMASAGEVARTLEGDCTEHAVLLAAMLRTRGIPSRVAVGVVYVDKLAAFGGHMWTEVNLDGHWIPLDATLGRGGIGSAHLKLADSSLSDEGPSAISIFAPLMIILEQLQIEAIE